MKNILPMTHIEIQIKEAIKDLKRQKGSHKIGMSVKALKEVDPKNTGQARDLIEQAAALTGPDATYNKLRDNLRQALKNYYAADEYGPWIEDFTDNTIIYNREEENKLYQVSYSITEGEVELGDSIEVRQVISYEPIAPIQQSAGVQESAITITEERPIKLIEKVKADQSIPVKIIQPGWGSSGYYPQEVLERDAGVYTEGLKMYWNHPTFEEEQERPERDLRDLAGVLVSQGRWEENGKEGPGIYADAEIFSGFQGPVEEMAKYIGLSHRANGKAMQGEAEGRQGQIINSIEEAISVDFVTMPGAGGQIVDLFESYRNNINQKNVDMTELEKLKSDLAEVKTSLQERETRIKELEAENQKLNEGQALKEAREMVSGELVDEQLPAVTKKRLIEKLSNGYQLKEGKLDRDAIKAAMQESIKDEKAYIAEISGGGSIVNMGESAPAGGNNDEALLSEAKQHWVDLGYTSEQAEEMVQGR